MVEIRNQEQILAELGSAEDERNMFLDRHKKCQATLNKIIDRMKKAGTREMLREERIAELEAENKLLREEKS